MENRATYCMSLGPVFESDGYFLIRSLLRGFSCTLGTSDLLRLALAPYDPAHKHIT